MSEMRAQRLSARIALPVVPVDGRIMGSTRGACYVDVEGFVVALTVRALPAMPNGIVVDAAALADPPAPGTPASVSRARIAAGDMSVALEGAPTFDLTVPANEGYGPAHVAARAAALDGQRSYAPALDRAGRVALDALLDAVAGRDLARIAAASRDLIGRGGGLTPEGDDLVGAAAVAVNAFAVPCALDGRAAWLDALVPAPDLRRRTNSLAATLVELARSGCVVEPLDRALDLGRPPAEWAGSLPGLRRVGHSTGPAWIHGCAAVARALAR